MPVDATQPYDDQNIFARILRGEIPSRRIYEDDWAIAFHDIAPQAPVHLLVIPKTGEYADVTELAAGDPELLANMVAVAKAAASQAGASDFRLVFNTGVGAGQTVFHVHAHVLAASASPLGERTMTLGMPDGEEA